MAGIQGELSHVLVLSRVTCLEVKQIGRQNASQFTLMITFRTLHYRRILQAMSVLPTDG
jgi:hypothetical protein